MSMTPAGIEPATFRFVAQHLKHCATAVPKHHTCLSKFTKHGLSLPPLSIQQHSRIFLCTETKGLVLFVPPTERWESRPNTVQFLTALYYLACSHAMQVYDLSVY